MKDDSPDTLNTDVLRKALDEVSIADLKTFLSGANTTPTGFSKMAKDRKRDAVRDLIAEDFENHEGSLLGLFLTELLPNTTFEAGQVTGQEPAEPHAEEVEAATGEVVHAHPSSTELVPADESADGPVANITATYVNGEFGQMLAEASGLDSLSARETLLAVEDSLERHHMLAGVLIDQIAKKEMWRDAGYKNIREWIESETGLGYRKAMYLRANAVTVRELGLTEAQLKGVSWSALRHVIPVLSADNADYWLDRARTVRELNLKAEVAGALAPGKITKGGGDDDGGSPQPAEGAEKATDYVKRTLTLRSDQADMFEAALDHAKVQGHTDNTAAAVDYLCATYLQMPVSEGSKDHVKPDTSDDGLYRLCVILNKEGGYKSLLRLMEAVDKVWAEAEISVDLPSGS